MPLRRHPLGSFLVCFAALPERSILLTYREGHRSLPDQTRAAINQIFNFYQAQFGSSTVKPELVLVGHSMGGLVARYILTNPTGAVAGVTLDAETRRRADFIRNHTRFLVTLASPHEGSPIPQTSTVLDGLLGPFSNQVLLPACITFAVAAGGVLAGPVGAAYGAAGCPETVQSFTADVRKGLNANLEAMAHLTPAFWRTMNTGPKAPHRAQRTDGTRIPIYSMGGRSPSGELDLGHGVFESTKAIPGGTWIHFLRNACFSEASNSYGNCRQRFEGAGLMVIDALVSSGYVTGLPSDGFTRAGGDTRLDQIRRSFKENNLLTPMAEVREKPEDPPILYFRGWQDDVVDSDGFVGVDSSVGYQLGTTTREYFGNGQCWAVQGAGSVRGSWYRIFDSRYPRRTDTTMREGSSRQSFPWDWTNHGNIHHRGDVGTWIGTELIQRAGPYVGPGIWSEWGRGGMAC
jgi:pimeloyl-ACP methyl ester carboxylesterase